MSAARPITRRLVRAGAAVALASALAACGGEDEPSAAEDPASTPAETAETPSETPVETPEETPEETTPPADEGGGSGCAAAPPAGTVAPPADEATYTVGTVDFAIELSDGTTDCVSFAATDGSAGSWSVDGSPELEVRFGSEEAGLSLTVTDYSDDGNDDIAAGEGDPFTGIQYDGLYFADSLHIGCTVEVLDLTATSSAGTFDCADIDPWPGGGWNGKDTELTIVSASGSWTVGA